MTIASLSLANGWSHIGVLDELFLNLSDLGGLWVDYEIKSSIWQNNLFCTVFQPTASCYIIQLLMTFVI